MAQTTIVITYCDMGEAEDHQADTTVTVGLDGRSVELDLCNAHVEELHDNLDGWLTVGRVVRGQRSRRSAGAGRGPAAQGDKEQRAAIRAWGEANGYNVGDRGRLPAALVTAYSEALLKEAPKANGGRKRLARV